MHMQLTAILETLDHNYMYAYWWVPLWYSAHREYFSGIEYYYVTFPLQ